MSGISQTTDWTCRQQFQGLVPPNNGEKHTPAVVEEFTRAMRSIDIFQRSFGCERYLREHEERLWIGKARYELLKAPNKYTNTTSNATFESFSPGRAMAGTWDFRHEKGNGSVIFGDQIRYEFESLAFYFPKVF
ncbi:uncharacterized protein RSE6_11303 [Rhynchosporium secalis]|uniref:Uncharacterized protein n=1 Tax=Rhynchosporium secalis TaxID=38038 RepID=A0A1E1MMM1_RHYSE|nr:uncharacterized protein RSE6_11303 [Rhynchosporium secalis]